MRALFERFRPGSGLISPESVPSELPPEHGDEEVVYFVSRLKALLTLFIWLVALLLCVLGSVGRQPPESVGEFLFSGCAILSVGVSLLIFTGRNALVPQLVPFLCALALFSFPYLYTDTAGIRRSMLFDLFLVLLITLPALMHLWSWTFQAVNATVIGIGGIVHAFSDDLFTSLPTIMLIVTAGVLSTLVVLVRRPEEDTQTVRWRVLASRLLQEVSLRHFPQQVWNVMLFQSALLVLLIFIDISLGSDELSSPVLAKLYGIAIVVFGSSLALLLPPHRIPRVIMLTTTLIGFVLSISRAGYADFSSVYFALPLVYLFIVTSPLHWAVELQLQLVWSLLLGDLLVKAAVLRGNNVIASWYTIVGEMLLLHRGEIAVLTLGAAFSIFLASTIRRYRFSHLSQFVDLYQLGRPRAAQPGSEDWSKQFRLENPCSDRILPERNRQLFFGLFCLGIVSSAFSSRLLLLQPVPSGGLVVASWVVFLLLWAGLVYQERKLPKWPHLWTFGAALKVLLLLWPTALLLTANEVGSYWIFWPVALCVGIGIIPWSLRELLPILLIETAFGVELSYRLELGYEANSILIGAGVLSALLSVQNARRIRERSLFVNFHRAIDNTRTEQDVLRVVGDYLQHLFDAEAVLVSASPSHLEFLRSGQCYLLRAGDWPLHELRSGTPDLVVDATGVGCKPVHWLPGKLSFFDQRLGVIAPSCGLLMELSIDVGLSERDRRLGANNATEKEERFLLFVVTAMPIYELVREQELMLAHMLGAVARLKLSSFGQKREQERLSHAIESQALQREYELSTLVHDINNTVQDLTLLCETILEDFAERENDGVTEDQVVLVERTKRIAAIARSVATVVSDAKRRRELEKIEDLTPRELVEVTEIIRELASFAAIRAERKRIRIEELKLPEEKVFVLVSVKEHLETILRNILNNAILYSKPGSAIRVQLRMDDTSVHIDVTDNGAGLTPEECRTVFVAGFRGKSSSGVHGGLGLGLAESLRVARAAGGDIVATSPGPGHGSTFSVVLPRQRPAPQVTSLHHWALLVDDQPALTDFYARVARAMNLQPEVASSVDEALAIVSQRGRPGLVLTDIHLGESNGLDLVQRLREDFGLQLPIVVISGLNSEDVMTRVRAVGATDFVAKPVGRRALFARIQSLIGSEGI